MKKIRLQWIARKEPEPEDFNFPKKRNSSRPVIVVFKGVKEYFRKLNGWNQFLQREIRAMTRECWLQKVEEIPDVPIGIHIRMQDFIDPKSNKELHTQKTIKELILWFTESLNTIREIAGFSIHASVFSDGREEELKDLLAVKNVIRVTTGSAIGDLLALSKSRILIATGASSFSAWASFLGQMPTISYLGQSLSWFNLINSKGYYVGEFNPNSPPQPFIHQVKNVL